MPADECRPIEALPTATQLWVVGVLFFGIGDTATTIVGLKTAGVIEIHPIAATLFEHSAFAAMFVLKSAAFGTSYLLWRWTPAPYSVGVPLGVAALGLAVTVWNSFVLAVAIAP